MDLSIITGYETIGAATGASDCGGTSISPAGSPNVKGSWVELTAATAAAACRMTVWLGETTSGARKYLVDIGIGAAGSEQVLIPDLHYDATGSGGGYAQFTVPVAIPAGTRVAARMQASVTGTPIRVMAILHSGPTTGLPGVGGIVAYGTDTSDSGLTDIDPGGTAGVDSSWVQLTAATSGTTRWLVVMAGHNAESASGRWLLDIATGAAGSETVLLSDIPLALTSGSLSARALGFAVNIPNGTRLSARARTTDNSSLRRHLDVAVYGMNAPAPSGGSAAHAHASWS